MKRLIAILLSLLMLVGLCSCTISDDGNMTKTQKTTAQVTQEPAPDLPPTQVIQTDYEVHFDSLPESKDKSGIYVFTSAAEIDNYCTTGKPEYESPTYNNFVKKCEKYNDAYFEDKVLVVLVLFAPSGSDRHELVGMEQIAGSTNYRLTVETTRPEMYNTMLAWWHILVEVDKDTGITSAEQIELVRTHVRLPAP